MIPVQSSRVTHIGWQPPVAGADTGRGWVVFSDGTSGYWDNMPLQTFEMFRDSSSKGKFIHTDLKDKYAFTESPLPDSAA